MALVVAAVISSVNKALPLRDVLISPKRLLSE
jgi:hypothetical protein